MKLLRRAASIFGLRDGSWERYVRREGLADPVTYLDPRSFRLREPGKLLRLLETRSDCAAARGLGGLWRNEQLNIADALALAQREVDALDQLLWVLYIDSNGPKNKCLGPPPNYEHVVGMQFLGTERAFFGSAVVMKALALSEGPLDESHFIRVAQARRLPSMPTNPEHAWRWLSEQMAHA